MKNSNIHGILSPKAWVVLLLWTLATYASAQLPESNGMVTVHDVNGGWDIEYGVKDYHIESANDSIWMLETAAANGYNRTAGQPLLPLYHRIITIPDGAEAIVSWSDERWEHVAVDARGQIAAAQGAQPKSDDWQRNSPVDSNRSECYSLPLATLTLMGYMRGHQVALLTISPFTYTPRSRELGVCRHVSIRIRLTPTASRYGSDTRQRLQRQSLTGTLFHAKPEAKAYANNSYGETPLVYVIVADPRYRESLQPLVAWKRQEGLMVEEMYTDSHDRTAIKAMLQQRYDLSTPLQPEPYYILLVGDVADIPCFPPQHRVSGIEPHRTDLYYAEYTGDYLPDALIGRLSVDDTAQLNHVIAKTLAYEQFRMADSSHLNRSLLVAGKELQDPAPTVTNGQINYLKSLLMQHDEHHDTLCYYNPTSDSLGAQILDHLHSGVGMVNYTAHCLASGWRNPTVVSPQFDSLADEGKLFIAINNCCRANQVYGDCFGEHLLRAANGGAVGAIGASSETLWEEDYAWSVGPQAVLATWPSYNDSCPGAFDRMLHTHGEPFKQQAVTLGQMVAAGNWAVSSSGSPHDAFYWEIYNLLGDPSLMPYIGLPAQQTLYAEPFHAGDQTMAVHGVPYARIAATRDSMLLGICTLDSNGNGRLQSQLPLTDSVLLTATAQYHRPCQTTAYPLPYEGSRLTISGYHITDLDGQRLEQLTLCDSAQLWLTVTNVGTQPSAAQPLQLSPDATLCLSDTLVALPSLIPHGDTLIALVVYPLRKTADRTVGLTSTCGDSNQQTMRFGLLYADIEVSSMQLTCNGVNVSRFQPATEYEMLITLRNTGRGAAKEVSITDSASHATAHIGNLPPSDSARCSLTLVSPSTATPWLSTLVVAHRSDTLRCHFSAEADTTVGLMQPEAAPTTHNIYPNPASETVTISGFESPTHIILYDIRGQRVADFFAQKDDIIQYSTHSLRCGLYNLLFRSSERQEVKKLIIVR